MSQKSQNKEENKTLNEKSSLKDESSEGENEQLD